MDKTPNYSAFQETLIRAAIAANGGVANKSVAETLAADPRMNKDEGKGDARTSRAITAKMVRMDVDYQRAEPTSKDGTPVRKKTDLVARIVAASGITAKLLDGLDKAPKPALDALAFYVESIGNDEPAEEAATGTDG